MIDKLKTLLTFKLLKGTVYFVVNQDFELKSEKSIVKEGTKILYSAAQLTHDLEVITIVIIPKDEDSESFSGLTHMTMNFLSNLVQKEIISAYYTRKNGLDREIEKLLDETTRREPD